MEKVSALARNFESSNLVTVAIGVQSPKKLYYVQKALLQNSSDLFRRWLHAKEADDEKLILSLPSISDEAFQFFLSWICGNGMPSWEDYSDDLTIERKHPAWRERCRQFQLTMIRLWLFAGIYEVCNLQDEALRQLLAFLSSNTVHPSAVNEVLSTTAANCVLRKVFVVGTMSGFLGKAYTTDEERELVAIPGYLNACREVAAEKTEQRMHRVGRMKSWNAKWRDSEQSLGMGAFVNPFT